MAGKRGGKTIIRPEGSDEACREMPVNPEILKLFMKSHIEIKRQAEEIYATTVQETHNSIMLRGPCNQIDSAYHWLEDYIKGLKSVASCETAESIQISKSISKALQTEHIEAIKKAENDNNVAIVLEQNRVTVAGNECVEEVTKWLHDLINYIETNGQLAPSPPDRPASSVTGPSGSARVRKAPDSSAMTSLFKELSQVFEGCGDNENVVPSRVAKESQHVMSKPAIPNTATASMTSSTPNIEDESDEIYVPSHAGEEPEDYMEALQSNQLQAKYGTGLFLTMHNDLIRQQKDDHPGIQIMADGQKIVVVEDDNHKGGVASVVEKLKAAQDRIKARVERLKKGKKDFTPFVDAAKSNVWILVQLSDTDIIIRSFNPTNIPQWKVGEIFLELHQGNIVEMKTDGIIHATDENISFKGQVGKSLRTAGGTELEEHCQTACMENGIAVTPGGKLPARYVIHLDAKSSKWDDKITNCLDAAEKSQMTSLALPSLGTGNYGKSASTMAQYVLSNIVKFAKTNPRYVRIVKIVLFDVSHLEAYHNCMEEMLNSEMLKATKNEPIVKLYGEKDEVLEEAYDEMNTVIYVTMDKIKKPASP